MEKEGGGEAKKEEEELGGRRKRKKKGEKGNGRRDKEETSQALVVNILELVACHYFPLAFFLPLLCLHAVASPLQGHRALICYDKNGAQ